MDQLRLLFTGVWTEGGLVTEHISFLSVVVPKTFQLTLINLLLVADLRLTTNGHVTFTASDGMGTQRSQQRAFGCDDAMGE